VLADPQVSVVYQNLGQFEEERRAGRRHVVVGQRSGVEEPLVRLRRLGMLSKARSENHHSMESPRLRVRLCHSAPVLTCCCVDLFRRAFRKYAQSWPELTMDQGAMSGSWAALLCTASSGGARREESQQLSTEHRGQAVWKGRPGQREVSKRMLLQCG